MRKLTFDLFTEWLEKEEVEYLATPDKDIIVNFEDMRVEHMYGDEVRIYLNKYDSYKVFELSIDYECKGIEIFWA